MGQVKENLILKNNETAASLLPEERRSEKTVAFN